MKHLIYLILLSLLSACSDRFLEQFPETSLNEGSFYKSENDFIGMANGLYTPLRDYTRSQFWILAEIPSDNTSFMFNASENASSSSWQPSDFFQSTASTEGTFDAFWTTSYRGITRCNKLLSELNRPLTWSNPALQERTLGEAKFMRALYYFNLVRLFGGIPLITTPIDYEQATGIARSTTEEIYNAIIKDLKEATTHLKAAKDVKEAGRATAGAALSLLGKVYLTRLNYVDAEATLKEVIQSGEYELLAAYSDVFDPLNKNHRESIFAVQYSENNAGMAQDFIFRFVPHTSGGAITQRSGVVINNSWHGWNMPTRDLI